MQEDFLIQKLMCNGEEIPRTYLNKAELIETMDLSGPKLILEIYDPNSYTRDTIGLKEGSIISATIADISQRDEMHEQRDFKVMKSVLKDDTLIANCLLRETADSLIPAKKPRLFPKGGKALGQILQELIPGLALDISGMVPAEAYHLLPSGTPNGVVTRMAFEMGAVAFICRGKLIFKQFIELGTEEIEIAYDDRTAENQVMKKKQVREGLMREEAIKRNARGWHIVEGEMKSSKDTDWPVSITPYGAVATLNNFSVERKKAVQIIVQGNGRYKPGMRAKIKWNMPRSEAPLDESIPAEGIISSVTHCGEPQQYLCLIVLEEEL